MKELTAQEARQLYVLVKEADALTPTMKWMLGGAGTGGLLGYLSSGGNLGSALVGAGLGAGAGYGGMAASGLAGAMSPGNARNAWSNIAKGTKGGWSGIKGIGNAMADWGKVQAFIKNNPAATVHAKELFNFARKGDINAIKNVLGIKQLGDIPAIFHLLRDKIPEQALKVMSPHLKSIRDMYQASGGFSKATRKNIMEMLANFMGG